MSYDFFMGQIRLALVALLSYAGGKGWLTPNDANTITAIAAALGPIVVPVLWSWSANWRRKMVPSDSIAISRDSVENPHNAKALGMAKISLDNGVPIARVVGCLLFMIILAPLFAQSALASDILPGSDKPITSVFGQPCTPTSCSGFYVGGVIGGAGTNADIIGNGVNGSVFAGGGIMGANVGYQYASGPWFVGAEAGLAYQFQTGATVNNVSGNASGLFGYQIVKFGGDLSGLLNNGNATGISIPPKLAQSLISPYLLTGAVERSFATGWATGAGATFDIGQHLFLDTKYMFVNYGPSNNGAMHLTNENLLLLGVNYKF